MYLRLSYTIYYTNRYFNNIILYRNEVIQNKYGSSDRYVIYIYIYIYIYILIYI